MPVQTILDPLQIPQSVKADAYDAYTGAAGVDDLQRRLDKLPLSNKVKADLWDLKNSEGGAAQPTAQPEATDTWDPRTWSLGHNPVTNTLAGIGAGAISTGVGAYNLARKIPGADKVLPAPSAAVQAATEAPAGFFGAAGKLAEQTGEFLVPMSKVAKVVEGSHLAARLAAEALAAGGVAGVQTGGDLPAIAETAATTGALGGVGAAIPATLKRSVGKALAEGGRTLSQGAQDIAAKYGIPLTQGMKTGNRTVQAVEKLVGHSVAPDLYEPILDKAQEGLNAGAADLAGNFATDRFSAGQKTINSLRDAAQQHATTAQTEYANLAAHEAAPANTRMVQVGTKPNLSLDPNAPATVPVMEPMGLPVDMRPTKAALAPLEEEFTRRMTPAQRRADPGLAAIQNILSRPDALPASVAEADLGYLKSIMRSEAPAQAKRLAGMAINSLDQQVKDAVSQAGPQALDSLNTARGEWAKHASIMDQVKGLTGDLKGTGTEGQTLLAKKLLFPSDANYPELERVLTTAPDAAEHLGKSFLADQVFKQAADGSDFTSPKQARNIWNQLGPRTKAALFTPEQIQDTNDLLELGKRLAENPNPSGTGTMNALLKMGVMATHPVAGVSSLVFGRNIAKILYNPEAAANVRLALDQLGTPQATKAMLAVKSFLNSGETAATGNGTVQ